MLKPSDEQIAAVILEKLVNKTCWAKGHTPIENTTKGIPSHDRGRAKEAVEELIKRGWILKYPTGHGIDVHLNINCKQEIFEFIQKYSLP